MDRAERAAYGRIGGLTAWSRHDAATMLGPAHVGFRRRFERLVDPEGVLDPRERGIRADRARRAYMLALAAKSAAARKRVRPDRDSRRAEREEANADGLPPAT